MATKKQMSRPSRARGLKLHGTAFGDYAAHVAPFTGAWIETCRNGHIALTSRCRALHGRVD